MGNDGNILCSKRLPTNPFNDIATKKNKKNKQIIHKTKQA